MSNGTRSADGTAKTLNSVVSKAQDITTMVGKISKSSVEQSKYLSHITGMVAEISQVIQTNSATAEESAAASEELSGQAQMMRSLVAKLN